MPKSTVLLFSSESAGREEVRAVLAGVGYPVTLVSDRAEALAAAANHQVLVVDLPVSRDGAAEFCRAIRRDAGLALLPILAIAQADDVEERIELIEAGVDEVIARPFDPRELEARMVALELRIAQTGDAAPEPVAAESRVERRLIVCFGPKGGTGTTTIAVNVAVALANHRPDAVAVIDLDTQFGDVMTHLDISTKRTIADLAADDPALDDAELMRSYASTVESGLNVYAAPASPALAELITAEVVSRLVKTARETYEVVVIDAGSHLDEATLNVLESADALIVTVRPEMSALKAVLSLNAYLREIEALKSSTIYVANHLFAKEMVRLRDIEGVLGARVAVEIPYDPYAFLKAVNEGVPIVRAAPTSVAAQRHARLAAMALGESRVVERPAPQGGRRRLLPGLRASR